MSIWHPPSQRPPANCTKAQWEWLVSTDSLTARIRQLNSQHTAMQLLYAGWGDALAEEHELLAQFPHDKAGRFWLREIMHVYQQQAWIWGRVVISEKTLRETGLNGESSQPLGDVLFHDPQIIRTQLNLAQLPPQHFYCGQVAGYLQNATGPLWSRRSILWFQQQPLLIAEVFLPGFFSYVENI